MAKKGDPMKSVLFFLVPVLLFAAPVFAAPAQVVLIRHAEKQDAGEVLSLKGKERAMALVPFFNGNPKVLSYGFPAAVYSAPMTRAIQTVKPLAESMKIAIVDKFSNSQIQPLVSDVLNNPDYEGKMVVICWSHKDMPRMASLLGAKKPPKTWSEEAHDRLWVLNYDEEGNVTFKDLPQKLLYGDSPK
jgi:phosphohistidine phosphatase SixA